MWLTVVRDIAIVLLALETLVIGVLLVITLLQIRSLVRMLRSEILPLLQSADDTLATVRGTTRFVSEQVTEPIMQVASVSAGAVQVVRSLVHFRQRQKNRRQTGTEQREGGIHG